MIYKMDKKILILILSTILIVINSLVYTKYVIYDDIFSLEYYIKWIPDSILILQTLFFLCYFFYENNTTYQYYYCIYMLCAYITCGFGDVLLIFDSNIMYMIGML